MYYEKKKKNRSSIPRREESAEKEEEGMVGLPTAAEKKKRDLILPCRKKRRDDLVPGKKKKGLTDGKGEKSCPQAIAHRSRRRKEKEKGAPLALRNARRKLFAPHGGKKRDIKDREEKTSMAGAMRGFCSDDSHRESGPRPADGKENKRAALSKKRKKRRGPVPLLGGRVTKERRKILASLRIVAKRVRQGLFFR